MYIYTLDGFLRSGFGLGASSVVVSLSLVEVSVEDSELVLLTLDDVDPSLHTRPVVLVSVSR